MSSSSSPAHLQPRDCPDFVSKPAIDTATPLVLRTEEQVAGLFACGGPAAAYRGEWLCFEAAFKAKGGIVFLNQVIGKEVDMFVLQGWKGPNKRSQSLVPSFSSSTPTSRKTWITEYLRRHASRVQLIVSFFYF